MNMYPGSEGYSLMLRGRNGEDSETLRLPYEVSMVRLHDEKILYYKSLHVFIDWLLMPHSGTVPAEEFRIGDSSSSLEPLVCVALSVCACVWFPVCGEEQIINTGAQKNK